MNNDFNTPNVITYLLDLVKQLNQKLRNKDYDILITVSKILQITNILGLVYDMPKLTQEQIDIYNKWNEARENKDYEKADYYRSILIEQKIL